MTRAGRLAAIIPIVLWSGRAVSAQTADSAQTRSASELFQARCATCHSGAADSRAPGRQTLAMAAPEAIVRTLTVGTMQVQGAELSPNERRAIAEFLTRRKVNDAGPAVTSGRCTLSPPLCDPETTPRWNGWGITVTNTRFQPAVAARLAPSAVPQLKLKWAFGFPDATSAWSQPVVVAGRLFVGSQNGHIYSLDAKTGCTYWDFTANTAVRSAITIGPRAGADGTGAYAAYFGDMAGRVYAISASNGELLWSRRVDDHQIARITGSPTLYADRLYVPVSSLEEASGGNPQYECCTFRGSVVALDARTGNVVWKTHALGEPRPMGKTAAGVQIFGPSGAAIWNAPTVDAKRRTVYAATGNQYTGPEREQTATLRPSTASQRRARL